MWFPFVSRFYRETWDETVAAVEYHEAQTAMNAQYFERWRIPDDATEVKTVRVGDILTFSQKFYRRNDATPPNEQWEVIARTDHSITVKSRFDGQTCVIGWGEGITL